MKKRLWCFQVLLGLLLLSIGVFALSSTQMPSTADEAILRSAGVRCWQQTWPHRGPEWDRIGGNVAVYGAQDDAIGQNLMVGTFRFGGAYLILIGLFNAWTLRKQLRNEDSNSYE